MRNKRVFNGPRFLTYVVNVGIALFGLRSTVRFLNDEQIAAMFEENDAGLSESEDEERAPCPTTSDVDSSSKSADEREPDIARPPTEKKKLLVLATIEFAAIG